MQLSDLSEDRLVETLLKDLPLSRSVVAGPGDDCAAVRMEGSKNLLLLKTDCIVESVHYLPSHPPAQVGWKALCRALSDIGAMGGIPRQALVTVFSPPDRPLAYWQGVYRGLRKAARAYSVDVVGGETANSPTAAISVSVTGSAERIIRRSGGKSGDCLFVTGRLGGSIAGKHLRFIPRLQEGQWLAKKGFATAMMDLSDGLGSDLPRLARASGCSFSVHLPSLPRTRGASIEAAVSDGEDYELLFACPPARCPELLAKWKAAFPKVPLTRIGELIPSREAPTPLPGGYDHFLRCQSSGKRTSR